MARLNTVKKFRGTSKTADGNLRCGSCGDPIRPGDGYRWWANRAPGQRGGFKQIRCMKQECTPSLADRTPGRAGQLLQIQDDAEKSIADLDFTETGDLEALAGEIGEQITELAQEMDESASNIESGFGHPTTQSDELRERASNVEQQASDVEQCSFTDPPEKDDFEDEDEYEEAMDTWREEQRDALRDAVGNVDLY